MVFDDENSCESRRVHKDFHRQRTTRDFRKERPKKRIKIKYFALSYQQINKFYITVKKLRIYKNYQKLS